MAHPEGFIDFAFKDESEFNQYVVIGLYEDEENGKVCFISEEKKEAIDFIKENKLKYDMLNPYFFREYDHEDGDDPFEKI